MVMAVTLHLKAGKKIKLVMVLAAALGMAPVILAMAPEKVPVKAPVIGLGSGLIRRKKINRFTFAQVRSYLITAFGRVYPAMQLTRYLHE
ncbi:hypothetical protein SAMN05660706_12727 [Desulfoscipio geothermicus DSM 3669]|uniref:Uncharacterized protein n=1 Tax=Desulfoscipio geothermicus DSM 3669 TaxID=1121426 RepID=A0A1I6E6K3_9FIRM|nr:hypothetical protein SAMN05660706_12727 [Desulfoscipio geothermicus DSM 3669]